MNHYYPIKSKKLVKSIMTTFGLLYYNLSLKSKLTKTSWLGDPSKSRVFKTQLSLTR